MFGKLRRSKTCLTVVLCLLLFLSVNTTAFAFGKGAKGPDVYTIQGMLKSLGYFPGNITGYYGAVTESSVKLFQKAYGLPITGTVDDQTLQSILWAYGNAKIAKKQTPTPTPVPKPEVNPTPESESEPKPEVNPTPESESEPKPEVNPTPESESVPKPEVNPTPKPEPAPAPDSSTGVTAQERQLVDLINQVRQEAGLAPLTINMELSNTARLKSKDMVDNNYFSHQSETYGSPTDMMKQFGISYSSAGENIACNQTVTAAHQALMNSPGHKAKILSADFTEIGIGIVDGGSCGKMLTEQFIRK
ncbi:peptidoglycan-binding protein [Paenibacillus radicis (ex Xue et al. 2023)]|uniref:Peptidoglycan-binding protein n=1 Tax=Paenibacillus radicis (ex Xue et al. 2023) TaxID=2972489 RepID=A0ABT1Y911_9BACL|nr:peptidoglycan-binding protein [Paenibacillus radicis (ex Xue et al. 2023)]MCR8629677.1 peptidoglycan-binding protein [Paenibacillus radicis (ex Xue et al. 2023)]